MYLKKLEIQGFKSFANKAALEFPDAKKDDKGITAIVGPNGSGKSNASDAIRWVLGEQSMKTLRGKRADDLIFSGSDKKSRLGFAEVALHLDNSAHIAPVDYEEIVITRRIYRSGESEYLLNKKPVRLADILMMLAKAKFAQKSYSVIGQGMIDSILVAPPAERKEFFDEAAGVKEFQIKRTQSLNKLKNTQTNLQQVDIMLREIEPRLRSLTRQVKRLERREEVEKELRENQIKYYSSLVSEIDGKIHEINGKKQEVAPQANQLETELTGIQKKLDIAAGQTTRSQVFAELQNELNKLVNEKNGLLREQAVLKGKLDVEYTKSGQINLVWLEKRKGEVENRIGELKGQMKNSAGVQGFEPLQNEQDKLQKVEMEIDRLKGRLEELKQGGSDLGDEEIKDALREIVEEQKKLVEMLNAGVQNFEPLRDFEPLQVMAQQIYQKIFAFREKFTASKDSQNIASELEQTQNSLNTLHDEKRDLMAEINEINVKLKIDEEKKILLEQELEREQDELAKIQAEITGSQAASNTDEQESHVKQQSEKIDSQIKELDVKILEIQTKINDFNSQEEKKKAELINLQREYSTKQNELHGLNNKLNEINIELTKLTTKQEGLMVEIKEELKNENLLIKNFSEEVNRDSLYNQIQNLKHQLELIGGIDDEVVKEYEQIKERYEFLHSQTTDLKQAMASLEDIIVELDKTIKKEFNVSFDKINHEFDKYFKILFNGGKARLLKISEEQAKENKTEKELALEEIEKSQTEDKDAKTPSDDIKKKFKKINIYSGVEIQATPPGKKVSSINMLSGGERAMTSIALICAIISCNPSPFVVLDEVDAALDEANSDRFAAILHELAHKTQFIAITHNRATMHQAKVLYGVTMGEDGVSKLLSVKMDEAERMRSS